MQTVPVSELRANMMKILKMIEGGASLNITSRGKVVARLVPPDDRQAAARKKLKEIRKNAVVHDVISPIDVEWKAM